MSERTISHYRLTSRLGAGGMGEVYKAEDTKLERHVALKLLPPEATRDPNRVQRFKQEAKATSALNHPNITTIHEVGEHDGQYFITIEFIEGETLRKKMQGGKLETSHLLDIAVQIAEGLHAAHSAGVVHRDLKPDNIMVRPDGITKILDFGLAKLTQRSPEDRAEALDGEETTIQPARPNSDSLTQPGMVMGTVSYMSPEQVRAEEVDHRSDVFAFGSILYELASGQQPFQADSSVELMNKILRDTPMPLHGTSTNTPVELSRIIRKAMAKNPEERYQNAKDLAIDLKVLKREIDSGSVSAGWPAVSGVAPAAQSKPLLTPLLIVALVLVTALAGTFWMLNRRTPGPAVSDLDIIRVTTSGQASAPAMSPDGKFVAYVESRQGKRSIWVHQSATGSNVELLPPGDARLHHLRFSPDGNWLYYAALVEAKGRHDLWRISALGGTPRRLLEDTDTPVSFAPGGERFVFGRRVGMNEVRFLVSAADGTGELEEVYTTPEEALVISQPNWSPDGESIAYIQIDRDEVLYPKLRLLSLASADTELIEGPRWMRIAGMAWAPDGSGLYVTGGRSWQERPAVWFVDRASGSSQRITRDLASYSHPSPRADGNALAAVRVNFDSNLWQLPVGKDASSNSREARRITSGTDVKGDPDISPDGSKVVYYSDAGGELDLWTMNLDGSNQRQLTFDANQDFSPRWSPDGRYIAYGSESDGDMQIWRLDAEGGNPLQLTSSGNLNFSHSWSPDNEWISFLSLQGDRAFIFKVPAVGGDPVQVSETQAMMTTQWSSDGRWIASWERPEVPGVPGRVALYPSDGTGEIRMLPITRISLTEMLSLRWIPGAPAVSLSLREGGHWNVVRYAIDDGSAEPLTAFEGDETMFGFCWSNDGRFMIAQRGDVTNDVVLLENIR